jgi:hydroxymethylglutaryl-CoA synthase
MLGNIYTGSLYNGLISLICDKSIDMTDQKVMMFSYGSGCAASLFYVHVKKGYTKVCPSYHERLNNRIKWRVEEYDQWM